MICSLVMRSSNSKTGPIPVTMTEEKSCPSTCPFKAGKLCYPYYSPAGFIWESLNTDGFYPGVKQRRVTPISWDELCSRVTFFPKEQVWRHNVAGDLPGEDCHIDEGLLFKLVQANKGKLGFTYTHKPVTPENAALIKRANKEGFRISLSADGLSDADNKADYGIAPIVVVVPKDATGKLVTPKGRKVISCPAQDNKIQCKDCKLCTAAKRPIVAFRAHGTRKNKVSLMVVK